MTDIIELTQRMREAAENATRGEWIKENGDGWEAICCDDDQANGNFIIAKFLGPDKARNREFVQAVQPQNIRTLCDAIAQRDAQNSELRAQIAALTADNQNYSELLQYHIDRQAKAEAQLAELAKPEPATDEANHCASVLEYIGQFESEDIDSDTVDLRFEIDGVDTGSDVSITEYATRSAKVIRGLLNRAAPPAPFVVQVDENGNPDGFISWYERKFSGQAYKGSSHVSDCDDAYRAGIHAAGGSVADE